MTEKIKREIGKYIKLYDENKLSEPEFNAMYDGGEIDDAVFTRVRAHMNYLWKRQREERESQIQTEIIQLREELQKKMI